MNNAAAYQTQIVARQRMNEAAFAAREYTRRRPARKIDASRTHHFHFHWPHPARAGFQH